MSKYDFKFILSKRQLFDFIINWCKYRIDNPLSEDTMSLIEIIEKISDDKMMFDSWVNNVNVRNKNMINKSNHYLQIKVDSKTFDFLNRFSTDFEVSISNFGEYAINSVISDLGSRTYGLSDSSVQLFLETFARNINNLYKVGKRSK